MHEPSFDASSHHAPDAAGDGTPVAFRVAGTRGKRGGVNAPRLQVAANLDARQIAARAVAIWVGVDAALSPVIGRRGFAALYKRSLHLAAMAHPFLATASQGTVEPGDFSALQQAIEQQPVDQGAAAQDAALGKFRELLANLIGESLTGRLVQPVWMQVADGQDAQDKS